MEEATVYKALGDPIRLQMVKRLASGNPSTIGDLSKNLDITRQGARKQLQVLVAAKIVHLSPQGRETWVQLDVSTLEKARLFIAEIEKQWDHRLNALKLFVEEKNQSD